MKWLTDNSRQFLERGYLLPGVTPEDRIRQIADRAQEINGIDGFADKFYKYMSEGYYSLASPVWSNFGQKRGLPISCFGSFVGDDMGEILFTQAEVGMMSKMGGGTSGYFGNLRHRGAPITNNGKSSGAVHFMQLFDKMVDIVSQGATRRGQFAPYLPLSHPDANEFLDLGTEGNPIQKLTHGVTASDEWMQSMIDGDADKRKLWAKVIQRRGEIGYPYIFFEDNVNKNTVDVYAKENRRIWASNLCTEIMLPSKNDESFVCCLSSINILHYDAWKDTDAVETLTYFLDTVMTEFIEKLEVYRDSEDPHDNKVFMFMERAYNFARRHRALGLGVLGWHSYLQKNMLSFESREAAKLNHDIFKLVQERTYKASQEMGEKFGEPEVLKGYGRRNTTTMAVAPTTSSAFILGQVSQGIEPIWSNCYVKDIQKIKTTIKNPLLVELLETKGKNDTETWRHIRDHDGSVQLLDCLTDDEKAVFKTYPEIDQMAIIYQASTRQKFIDQGQSLNVIIHPDTPIKDINNLYIEAWKLGIKTLYYQHSMNAAQQLNQKKVCAACEG
ncbi:ribonucleoside-diphosphate reductase subunit alpha [bacterium]|nr:ribonucleoside-diphosphate reductase subunit alpha [bacterium]NCQ55651.1 ribonucleoside-diphosphate reductase subunit alpha [Candidatus Parcubacteria bacterium]NCS67476.1 ribonucleoside-diphosphate reductase subunit alpha [Candidatus Peregrinibacteria bacterium]NCS96202.1 ribonucleoside-diphosphate reductase subunit alpha [bacterium]